MPIMHLHSDDGKSPIFLTITCVGAHVSAFVLKTSVYPDGCWIAATLREVCYVYKLILSTHPLPQQTNQAHAFYSIILLCNSILSTHQHHHSIYSLPNMRTA